MKRWNLYVSLLLALMMCLCLAACGGEEEEEISAIVLPSTIEDLALDDSVDFDYSDYMGTWVDEEGDVLVVETYDDGRVHFTVSDADDYLLASGCLQYVEEYDTVYAHNDFDGIAYMTGRYIGDELFIESFGTFDKVSGDVPGDTIGDESGLGISALSGSWLPDSDTYAETTIDISDDTWILWMLDSDGMWGMMDSGSLQDLGDGDFAAISEYDGEVYEIFLVDEETMFWNDDYYLKAE